jgi:transposase
MMTAPLSQDLRERIVHAVEDGSTIRQAGRRFAVSASAAIKLMQRVRQTGSPAPAKIGGHRRPILEPHADTLRTIATSQAGITLREIKAALAARGIAVKALSTIADMLHRLGLSHKKEPESCRARPSRCGPTPPPLAGMAALYGCRPFCVPGRNRCNDEHDPALWLG